MTYTLFVGDTAHSSWSLRGYLLVDALGLEYDLTLVRMYSDEFDAYRTSVAPARTVPALKIAEDGDGALVWESLAIAETLAERHPDKPYWPAGLEPRATMRALANEMHAGFGALRAACPMNLRVQFQGFEVSEAVAADLARLELIWTHALERFSGPFLGGAEFGAVDAMFAPVATRIVTYDLPCSERVTGYIRAIYTHPSFLRWRAMADADPRMLDVYDQPYPAIPHPVLT